MDNYGIGSARRLKGVFIILLALLSIASINAQNSAIVWSTIDAGAGQSSASGSALRSVLGQTLAGEISLSNNFIRSGFLANPIMSGALLTVDDGGDLPTEFILLQNYPNPFNPSTTIRLELPAKEFVRLTVFNLLGREVAMLLNQELLPGVHHVRFDAAQLASGIYFYRIQAGSTTATKKLILLR